MTNVKTSYVASPIGNVTQIHDVETDMYLGHFVYSVDAEVYVCTRIDAHDCVESHWRTNSYSAAVAYVECAMDSTFLNGG